MSCSDSETSRSWNVCLLSIEFPFDATSDERSNNDSHVELIVVNPTDTARVRNQQRDEILVQVTMTLTLFFIIDEENG